MAGEDVLTRACLVRPSLERRDILDPSSALLVCSVRR
jgi:hypothetical protein